MSDDDWKSWSREHARLFVLDRNNEDLLMVASWRPLLELYALSELKIASAELLKDPPRFRDQHVAGLLRILGGRRASMAKAYASQASEHDFRTKCGACDSTGWVQVPHPNCLQGGEFVAGPGGYKTTFSVICSCGVGARKLGTFDGTLRRPMTLATYEAQICGGWQALLDEWRQEKSARNEMLASAANGDRRRGPLSKSLANRLNLVGSK